MTPLPDVSKITKTAPAPRSRRTGAGTHAGPLRLPCAGGSQARDVTSSALPAERALAVETADTEAFRRRHRGLLVRSALRYVSSAYALELEDLLAIGEMALHKAALSYRPSRGREAHWAEAHLRTDLFRAVRDSRPIPAYAQAFWREVRRQLGPDWRERYTDEDGAAAMGVSMEMWRLRLLALLRRKPASLEAISRGEEGEALETSALKDPSEPVEDLVCRRAAVRALREAVSALSSPVREVIELTYLSEPPLSLRQAGAALGYSAEWVRGQQRRGLIQLRERLDPADVEALMSA